jgi:autotransporter-associated beta strand protein
MGAISDQSGDTRLSGNNVWPTVIAAANASLGTGRVRIQKTGTGTATLILRAPAPVLGSLESAGSSGTRAVTLGNTGVTLVSGALKATWTSGSSLLTVTTGSADSLSVGQVISSAAGNGIPDGATIVAIRSGTQFEISANTTVSKTATSIGAAPVNTTVSVGSLNRDGDVFDVAIGQASGTVGSLTKVGTGAWTLSGASTYTGTTRVEAGKITLTGSLGSGKVQVAGGTFEGGASGSRTATFNLGSAPDGMVLTSGALDISKINLSFAGAADLTSYTLVDYSAGGTLTTATGVPATENTFASAANVPAGYKWLHDTSAKKVLLFLPPAVTVITIR